MRNASLFSRLGLLAAGTAALPGLLACLDHPLKPVEYDQAQEIEDSIALTVNKDVDILFVIDNSGSMAEEQATLAANFASFIDVLEADDVKANYRIGVTTTDNGNPWCNGTSPEGGALRLTSCRSRQQEFVFMGAMPVDATQEACLDICGDPAWDTIDIQPTETSEDPNPKPRPWMENVEGKTNLPDTNADGVPDISTVQAFQCFGPQGINGCGFEQHLESMYKGLKRTENADEASFGFLRANAILSVVFITDEADCSHNGNHSTIFLPTENDGNEVFWSDPAAQSSPTSAVCWNAGVSCTGGGSPYDECHAQNKGVDGSDVSDAAAEDDAVLHPLNRYVDLLQAYETQKQMITPGQEVLVAALDGVPEGYEAGGVDIQYQISLDPQDQLDFGIGPACETVNGKAVPSVRIREFAEEFEVGGARNLYSICAANYGVALQAIADTIRDQIKPACMPACVADSDPLTPDTIEPNCNLEQVAPNDSGGTTKTEVPECNADGSLPDGENVCYIELTGADLDMFCSDQGYNLQFQLVRRAGFPAPGGTSVSATCQLSQQKEIDCPNL